MIAREVMTEKLECIPPTATLAEAAGRMRRLDVGALPVCENDQLVGMITDRDIVVRSVSHGDDPKRDTVRDIMTPEPSCCFDEQDVSEVAQLMHDKQIRRVPVLNRAKRLVGMVSLADLALEDDEGQLSARALKGISEPALAAH
jgi:CBS domain-containing protein